MKIAVIDGQGGGLGKAIIESLKEEMVGNVLFKALPSRIFNSGPPYYSKFDYQYYLSCIFYQQEPS